MDDDDYGPSSNTLSLSPGVGWGLSGLIIGCTLLVAGCTLMVFNVIFFAVGMGGVDQEWAQRGGVIGVVGMALFGLFGIWCGARGWAAARRTNDSAALGIAGTVAGFAGLIAWLIAGIDLLAILRIVG
jgi:hypothetical protein